MTRYQGIEYDQNNAIVPGAKITVLAADGKTLATLTDDMGNNLLNPVTSDSLGVYYFNAAVGTYWLDHRVSGRLVLIELVPVGVASDAVFKGDPGSPGPPGGNTSGVGPRSIISTIIVPVGTNRVGTDGAASTSDLGASDYVLDAAQPAPGADAFHKLTSAGKTLVTQSVGRGTLMATALASAQAMESRFRPVDNAGRYFLLKGGVTHLAYQSAGDTPRATIQAMIDANVFWKMYEGKIAGGAYTLDGPLYLTGRGDTFYQARLKGSGRNYYGSSGTGTALTFTDPTRAGIIVQSYRDSSVDGMTLIGAAYAGLSAVFLGGIAPVDNLGNLIDDYDASTWYTYAGLSPRQNAPHAAIALDPFSGTAPAGSAGTLTAPYPTDTPPAWHGPIPQYGHGAGSQFYTDCQMLGWEIGVCDPPTSNSQGDYTTLNKVSVALSIYGASSNRNQARNFTGYELNIALVHTALSNRIFGPQGGKMGGTITISGGSSIKLFDLDATSMGCLTLQDSYTETQHMLGDIYAPIYTFGSLIFVNGTYDLTVGNTRRGHPPYHLGNTNNAGAGVPFVPVRVEGTGFAVMDVLSLLIMDLQFTGTIFSRIMQEGYYLTTSTGVDYSGFDRKVLTTAEERARRMAHNGTLGLVTPMMMASFNHRITGQQYNIDTNADTRPVVTNAPGFTASSRAFCIPHWQSKASPSGFNTSISTALEVTMPRKTVALNKSVITGFARTSNRWAGTLGAGYRGANAWNAASSNIGPGRICMDDQSGTAFWVCSYDFTSGAIVLEQLLNFKLPASGTVKEPRFAISSSTGALWFAETGYFMPSNPMIGDISSASAVITNLRRSTDGDFAWLTAGTPSLPATDDWIYYDTELPSAGQPFTAGASRVVSINPGARTLTMSGNANFTATGVALPLWRRAN